MKTISCALIVKNESQLLPRLLACLDFADEVVVVDTGSTDDTKKIAENFGAKVFDFPWKDDFSAARNFSFRQCGKQYVMWLDADDVIEKEDREKIKKWKNGASEPDTVMAKYCASEDEEGNPSFYYFRERILKNCAAAHWQGKVHEAIVPFGQVERADFTIRHRPSEAHTSRNLAIYEKMLQSGEKLCAREKFYYARELYFAGEYDRAEGLLKEFVEEKEGWRPDKICALITLAERECGKNNVAEARKYLAQTLVYGEPCAEVCCRLGGTFYAEKQYDAAVFWYEAALRCRETEGFVQKDWHDLVPLTQLTVCCFEKGDTEKAKYWSGRACEARPRHPTVLYNKRFFETLKDG